MRDRSFENQRYRASGLNLLTAAIVLWNTVYLERAIQAIRDHGGTIDQSLLQHLSPLGWEHINLTGDYVWRQSRKVEKEGNSDHYGLSCKLNVLYIPFREATPSSTNKPRFICEAPPRHAAQGNTCSKACIQDGRRVTTFSLNSRERYMVAVPVSPKTSTLYSVGNGLLPISARVQF